MNKATIQSLPEALVYAAAFVRHTDKGGVACMHRAYQSVIQLREPQRRNVVATVDDARAMHQSFLSFRGQHG